MEPKKINQKLKLNKQTIANLNATELSRVFGGYTPPYDSVNYCDPGGGGGGGTVQVCTITEGTCWPAATCDTCQTCNNTCYLTCPDTCFGNCSQGCPPRTVVEDGCFPSVGCNLT